MILISMFMYTKCEEIFNDKRRLQAGLEPRVAASQSSLITTRYNLATSNLYSSNEAFFLTWLLQSLYRANMTREERELAHKNLLSYNNDYDLDIPPHMDDIMVYRATLGHKVNHSFQPNTRFGFAKNPRYHE